MFFHRENLLNVKEKQTFSLQVYKRTRLRHYVIRDIFGDVYT